uniref:NIF system FeS cluster assembly NifU C-terminal domain-containing protein n=1 Tax=Corethron hystrix TaxID=216773 RepID=A0A7S1G1H4_9STRA|eukprot:CAMPEP_0113309626 /NCGR_PEP_ID=MMETSP0010_2-20120614/7591_1 /TAXON_ID=216773 ORGANISM="Corethron hystrix, Strain 308" /NCGR_SAMPLE_ID=MMETSP0010_2 /ASSEMBLY_ACC=CAM_ASM_000155 /LENGTH=248 /DNA_ID=CAMNT_0000164909 /DNA_START=63 /DNA_END=809 /DNA_ORIENTATION=+ /assembly_acc=CAM_ASM_000155
MPRRSIAALLLSFSPTTSAFVACHFSNRISHYPRPTFIPLCMTIEADADIISPFAGGSGVPSEEAPPADPSFLRTDLPILDLTLENVEIVLDEMRPFLQADGGDVSIDDIDGPVVKLQLEGACGTCPSSTQTMKMGLERRLKERIPEIQEVVQAMPEGPPLNEDQINVVLDGVRPFLNVAGGSIDIASISGEMSVQPVITLEMTGASASLNSVKLEIEQRIQRHFMMSGLRITWAGASAKGGNAKRLW